MLDRPRATIAGVALIVTALIPLLTPAAAAAGHVRDGARASSPTIRDVPLESSYETSTRAISRDIGVSVALPDGHELWLFGDTGITQRDATGTWDLTGFIDGSTALEAKFKRGQVPHGGEYPSGAPTRFIPPPNDVYLPDSGGQACVKGNGDAGFRARWPTGIAVWPANTADVLITYSVVCVTVPTTASGLAVAEGWGYALYDWRTHRFARGPLDVVRPKQSGATIASSQILGQPIFMNGKLTLFSSSCLSEFVACNSGRVWAVTMPETAAALDKIGSYKLQQLSTDTSGTWLPLSISVGNFPVGLRLVEETSIAGNYSILSAPKLGAKWHIVRSGVLPGCPSATGFCFALEGHPELSTNTSMFVSYKNPDSGQAGHIVISALPY
jgi:hypothetical protein